MLGLEDKPFLLLNGSFFVTFVDLYSGIFPNPIDQAFLLRSDTFCSEILVVRLDFC